MTTRIHVTITCVDKMYAVAAARPAWVPPDAVEDRSPIDDATGKARPGHTHYTFVFADKLF
jgi:hypothetical protein